MPAQKPWTDADWDTLVACINEGLGRNQISNRMNRGHYLIDAKMRERGLHVLSRYATPPRPEAPPPHPDVREETFIRPPTKAQMMARR